MSNVWYVGVDIGGTFTDVVASSMVTGQVVDLKVPSSREDPASGFIHGLTALSEERRIEPGDLVLLVHGTTLATNAIIRGNFARTALLTTAGFRDVLAIGRHFRSDLYDPFIQPSAPLVPRELRLEIGERTDADGREVRPVDLGDVDAAVDMLRKSEVEAVAVVFLHSYRNPGHEALVANRLRKLGPEWAISASSELSRELREYERTATTVLNASLIPLVDSYLDRLERGLAELGSSAALFVTQSNGGALTPQAARTRPVNLALSGPVGGVTAAVELGRRAGLPNLITLDMGGTSADVSVISGCEARFTTQIDIGELPVRLPCVEVHSIGAGGGSVAFVEPSGGLRVGPDSAESDPGPACYGRGGVRPTVTDCQLLLGRLSEDVPLGGRLRLDADAAAKALDRQVATEIGLPTDEAAAGVIEVANAAMERAIRVALRDRGDDPRDFALVAFGGAGPLHAAELAARLDIATVVVPPHAGTLSALGLLSTDIRLDFAMSHLVRSAEPNLPKSLAKAFADLERQAQATLHDDEDVRRLGEATLRRSCDVRYAGQAHELNVPIADGQVTEEAVAATVEAFHLAHERAYGFSDRDEGWELVTFRVFASVPLQRPALSLPDGLSGDGRPAGERRVFSGDDGWVNADIFDGSALSVGSTFSGPAVVHQRDTTTFVPAGVEAFVDDQGNLMLSLTGRAREAAQLVASKASSRDSTQER